MERNDLLHHCRYYKGEKENPFEGDEAKFWEYERAWIEEMMKETDLLPECIEQYIGLGLRNFEKADDTPLSLKALLYNRYEHWLGGSPDGFRKWYKETYKKGSEN